MDSIATHISAISAFSCKGALCSDSTVRINYPMDRLVVAVHVTESVTYSATYVIFMGAASNVFIYPLLLHSIVVCNVRVIMDCSVSMVFRDAMETETVESSVFDVDLFVVERVINCNDANPFIYMAVTLAEVVR